MSLFPFTPAHPNPRRKKTKINVTIYRLQTTGLLQNHTCPVLLSYYTEPCVSYVQYSGGTPSVRKWICTTDQTHRRRHIISTDTGVQYESITSLVQTEGLQYRTVKNAQGVVGGCISGKWYFTDNFNTPLENFKLPTVFTFSHIPHNMKCLPHKFFLSSPTLLKNT